MRPVALQNLQRSKARAPTDEEQARGMTEKRMLGANAACSPDRPAEGAGMVLMAEGYATAASLHEARGMPVAVGFDAGNLVAVAEVLLAHCPGARFLVCGDDDTETEARTGKNPGRDGAEKAARKLRALGCAAAVLLPQGLPEGGSDFNDLAIAASLDEVACLAGAADTPTVTAGRQTLKPRQGRRNVPRRRERERRRGTAGRRRFGRASGRGVQTPALGGRDSFTLDERGVWFIARDNNGDDRPCGCAPRWWHRHARGMTRRTAGATCWSSTACTATPSSGLCPWPC